MDRTVPRRGRVILAAGVLIQLFTGLPSAWAVLRAPVMDAYSLDAAAAERIFSFLLGAFGVGGVLGGLLLEGRGPRTAGLLGAGLLGLAFGLAGALPAGHPLLFYLAFSLPAGLGSAFLLPAVLSCAQKWYAGKKGLATGLIGGASGASGAVLTLLILQSCGRWGVRACLRLLGAVLTLLCGGGSLLLREPLAQDTPAEQGLAPRQMLRTRQFRLCLAAVCLSCPAVLLFSPIILELAAQRGLDGASPLLCVMLGSAASAAGRLTMPLLGDHIGRRRTESLLFAALLLLSAGLWRAQGPWVIAAYCGLSFCYAGIAGVMPSLCTELFGLAHTGPNCALILLGTTLGSMGFPLLARTLGLEDGRHFIAMAAAAGGLCCIRLLRPLDGPRP